MNHIIRGQKEKVPKPEPYQIPASERRPSLLLFFRFRQTGKYMLNNTCTRYF